MDVAVNKVTEADAPAIIALLNPIIQAGRYTVMTTPFTVADQLAFIRSFPQRGVYHIARSSSQIALGIQDVMPISESNVFKHVGEISTFVALDAQKQGIGQRLSQVTFQAARAQGFLKLRATVRADNPSALAFYQSQGFEVLGVAQRHALLQNKYIDEILLEKFLE